MTQNREWKVGDKATYRTCFGGKVFCKVIEKWKSSNPARSEMLTLEVTSSRPCYLRGSVFSTYATTAFLIKR